MKNIMQSAILLVVAASCSVEPVSRNQPIESTESSDQFARQVIAALQHTSFPEYVSIFPKLEDFYQVMDAHGDVYGGSLAEAKREFGIRYEADLLPAVNESFARTIREGEGKVIGWNEIRFERVLHSAVTDRQFAETQVTIEFSANGKQHMLVLEKVLIINGKWKAGTRMQLL